MNVKLNVLLICLLFCCCFIYTKNLDQTNSNDLSVANKNNYTYKFIDCSKDQWLKQKIEMPEQLYRYRDKFQLFLKSKSELKQSDRLMLYIEIVLFITDKMNTANFSTNLDTFIWELANQSEFTTITFIENYLESLVSKRKLWKKLGQWVSHNLFLGKNDIGVIEGKKILKKWALQYPHEIGLMLYQTDGFKKIENLAMNKNEDQDRRLQCIYILANSDYINVLNIFNELKEEKTLLHISVPNIDNGNVETGFFYNTFGELIKNEIKNYKNHTFIRYPVSHFK